MFHSTTLYIVPTLYSKKGAFPGGILATACIAFIAFCAFHYGFVHTGLEFEGCFIFVFFASLYDSHIYVLPALQNRITNKLDMYQKDVECIAPVAYRSFAVCFE